MKKFLIMLGIGFLLNGCISPKTDALLVGAGLGAGVTYYFLNGGKSDGISKVSLSNSLQNSPKQNITDTSIPSELEWYYFDRDLYEQTLLNQKQSLAN